MAAASTGVNDPNRVYDGMASWEGGVDSSLPATLLNPNQAAWAVNRDVRGGYNDTRPGFIQRKTGYVQGLFQGAGCGPNPAGSAYYADDGDVYLPLAIAGRIFLTNVSQGYAVTEITGGGLVNNPMQPQQFFCQAGRMLICQDGLNLPIFWNGVSARRSNGNAPNQINSAELPVGTAMAFYQGRVWIAQGSNYVAGDIINGNLDLPDPRDSVVGFTENDYLNEGGSFSVPSSQGAINAIGFTANIDTTLGQGSLLVGTSTGIWTFDAPTDRTTWKSLQQPLQRDALIGSGPVSQQSLDFINGDVYFRSADFSLRSYFFARRDYENQWGNTPLSRQIQRAIDGEAECWMYNASGAAWQNRYLFTVQPQRDQVTGIYFLGLGCLDFFNVGGIGRILPPAWNGIWTGLQIFQVVTATVNNVLRFFAWVRNPNTNTIELWEIDPNSQSDYNGSSYVPIGWAWETKAFTFASQNCSADDRKQLQTADLWMDNVAGPVALQVYYKPSLGPSWVYWGQTSVCAGTTSCSLTSCTPPVFDNPLAFDRIGIPRPDDAVNPANNSLQNWGYNFQVRVTGSGQIRFKDFRIAAQKKPEGTYGNIDAAQCIVLDTTPCSPNCT